MNNPVSLSCFVCAHSRYRLYFSIQYNAHFRSSLF